MLCLRVLLLSLLSAHSVRVAAAEARPRDPDDERNFFTFHSRPDIHAPRWNVTMYNEKALTPGYWFISPYQSLSDPHDQDWIGPCIYDTQGELVWSGVPFFQTYNVFDFRSVQIGAELKMTLMYSREHAGLILNSNYQIEKVVDWPGEAINDNIHEFSVYDNGRRAVILTRTFQTLGKDRIKGQIDFDGDCRVEDDGMLDLDITTSPPTVLFSWKGLDHIAFDEATFTLKKTPIDHLCAAGWDWLHLNSVDVFPDGDYLISARYTNALYKISHVDGSIVWRLGGKQSDWEIVGDALFSTQHHARVHEQNETHTLISIFDNAKAPGGPAATSDSSRGLLLSLHDGKAETSFTLPHPHNAYSYSRGSFQFLPNGNKFVGWVFKSLISEHSSDGTMLMEAELLSGKNTYRSYKMPWIGAPLDPPDVLSKAAKQGTETIMYASWNGATEVTWWNFYETDINGTESNLIVSTPREGFETMYTYRRFAKYVYAEALNDYGEVLGRSKVIRSVPPHMSEEDFVDGQEWLETHVPVDIDTDAPAVAGTAKEVHTFGTVDRLHPFGSTGRLRPASSPSAKPVPNYSIHLYLFGGFSSLSTLTVLLLMSMGKLRMLRRPWFGHARDRDRDRELLIPETREPMSEVAYRDATLKAAHSRDPSLL